MYDISVLKIAIIGASGFTGAELLRLCANHPDFSVVVATGETQVGAAVADLYPSLAAYYPNLSYTPTDPIAADGCDVAFLGLPHGASQTLVPDLLDRVGHVVDLAADFRLREADLYPKWYGEDHQVPALLDEAVYGLPELFRSGLPGARLVAHQLRRERADRERGAAHGPAEVGPAGARPHQPRHGRGHGLAVLHARAGAEKRNVGLPRASCQKSQLSSDPG